MLALGLFAGCGGGDSPEDAVQAYYDAASDEDAEAVCELLSAATIEEIEATGSDCPTTFEEVGFGSVPDDFEIGEVTEEGDAATVEATADGTTEDVPLIDEDGEWKLDFAAATPEVPSEEPTTTAPEESAQP